MRVELLRVVDFAVEDDDEHEGLGTERGEFVAAASRMEQQVPGCPDASGVLASRALENQRPLVPLVPVHGIRDARLDRRWPVYARVAPPAFSGLVGVLGLAWLIDRTWLA